MTKAQALNTMYHLHYAPHQKLADGARLRYPGGVIIVHQYASTALLSAAMLMMGLTTDDVFSHPYYDAIVLKWAHMYRIEIHVAFINTCV